jgi:hypothetical protein
MNIKEELLKEIEKQEKKMESLKCVKCNHPEVSYIANEYMGYCDVCVDILGMDIPKYSPLVNDDNDENMAI